MASSFFNFLLLLSVFSVLVLPIRGGETSIAVDHNNNEPAQIRIDTEKISQALSDAGYLSMSLSLEVALPTVISSTTINTSSSVITIFAPPDDPFYKFKYYRQPPITLLQYHVAPTKLDQETLRSPAATPHGSKIDTFLPGHPLVVTTQHNTTEAAASINGVQITQWNIYNDGNVVVHGVADFFDPAYQTILYPWFDNSSCNNNVTNV
ncbi:Fas1 domain [Thalictrum thalictroides]|uniref:Fas1 domain n=1 Tax=Thalictrum thalictroides TaxID=46969 RepID=A0A7J6X7E2_THATH|nr:Fas1 domain [Thalictrum thalictroides]